MVGAQKHQLKRKEESLMESKDYLQPVLPGMTEREILEGFKPDDLLEYRGFLLEKYSDLERAIHEVNGVLDGYGVSYGEDNVVLGEN